MTAKKAWVSIGDADIKRFRVKLKKILVAAKKVTFDPEQIETELEQIASKIPDPPKLIRGEKDLFSAQRVVVKIQALRTRLVQLQRACERAKTNLSQLLEVAQGWIKSDPWVATLKNESMRGLVLHRVAPRLTNKHARVIGCLKEIDHILWGLKDNQGAVLIQINAWKEETWAHRQGIE